MVTKDCLLRDVLSTRDADGSHGGHNNIAVCLAFFQLDGIVNSTWVLIVYRCHGSQSSQAVRLSGCQAVSSSVSQSLK